MALSAALNSSGLGLRPVHPVLSRCFGTIRKQLEERFAINWVKKQQVSKKDWL